MSNTGDQKISIVIPTYNEAENIEAIIKQLIELRLDHCSIIIVDDNSPDKTGDRADALAQQYNNIIVIHRPHKIGLGPAYQEGLRYALSHGADILVQMDADFSHDPAAIPTLLQDLSSHDVVIGSRYVSGGRIENWNFIRRFISFFGNVYARIMLGVPIYDLTSGFKCYRRRVLETINIERFASVGYVFQIETVYKAFRAGLTIHEVPITFTERKVGSAKFDVGIFIEAFIRVLELRWKKYSSR